MARVYKLKKIQIYLALSLFFLFLIIPVQAGPTLNTAKLTNVFNNFFVLFPGIFDAIVGFFVVITPFIVYRIFTVAIKAIISMTRWW